MCEPPVQQRPLADVAGQSRQIFSVPRRGRVVRSAGVVVGRRREMAFPAHVRRCLCFLTEILFLAGLIWLLLLFLATLLGGSQGAAERAGGLIIGMAFLLPAPLLFIFDLGLRRYSHGSRQVVPETSSWSSGVLWPAARRSRRAPDPSPRSSPDVLPEEPGASAMPQWWAERPPTYDEAMRMPKLEELGPRVHQSGRGHVIFHV